MFVVSSFLSDLDFLAASQPNQVTVPLSHSPPGILAQTLDLMLLPPSDMHLLVSFSTLSPFPCLGNWGSRLSFRSPALCKKAVYELQQMDAVLDPCPLT